jgi:hypothetical protein
VSVLLVPILFHSLRLGPTLLHDDDDDDDDVVSRVCKTPGDPCGCTRQYYQRYMHI